jgi:hypothetical protein
VNAGRWSVARIDPLPRPWRSSYRRGAACCSRSAGRSPRRSPTGGASGVPWTPGVDAPPTGQAAAGTRTGPCTVGLPRLVSSSAIITTWRLLLWRRRRGFARAGLSAAGSMTGCAPVAPTTLRTDCPSPVSTTAIPWASRPASSAEMRSPCWRPARTATTGSSSPAGPARRAGQAADGAALCSPGGQAPPMSGGRGRPGFRLAPGRSPYPETRRAR